MRGLRPEEMECVETFEQTKAKLEAVEAQLAERLGIRENVREEVISRIKANTLIEDELVSEWHCLYSSYLDWLQNPRDNHDF